MEEIAEEAGRGVWAAVRFVFWHILFEIVLFNIGRVVLLAGSLGRFPRSRHLPQYQNQVACVGIAIVVAGWFGLVLFNRTVGAS